ncbi:MAG: RsmF rRNA methyltransferase first C-terminal domain-containing protein [Peptostreptococcus porci]|nr:RsmF rRNA methyltransferase first C-terminal domain-containing protein [Peptostreptococcus porci]
MSIIRDILPVEFKAEMKTLLGDEYSDFISSYDENKTNSIRINTLKIAVDEFKKLSLFNIDYSYGSDDSIGWSDEGYYVGEDEVPGKCYLHDAGAYYIQEPSAMSVVGNTEIKEGEKILDLCAAPGGKSTYILSKLNGTGILFSNEINTTRIKALGENLERFGAINSIITNSSSKELLKFFKGYFDKVFIDAPCSGQGMFRKDEYAIKDWSVQKVDECVEIQKYLIRDGYEMLKPNGILIYSTCTFTRRENEDIVDDFIRESGAEILAMDRIWPHKDRGEGHFCARLMKSVKLDDASDKVTNGYLQASRLKNRKKGSKNGKCQNQYENISKNEEKLFLDFLNQSIRADSSFFRILGNGKIVKKNTLLYFYPKEFDDVPELKAVKILRAGLQLGELKKNRFEPSHSLAMALKTSDVKHFESFGHDSEEIMKFISGESIQSGKSRGWVLIAVNDVSIGWCKESGGVLKNKYPKGLRKIIK